MNIFRYMFEGFQARKRGEKRIAPRQVSGRVFEKKETADAGFQDVEAKARGTMTSRIWRAETGTWEEGPSGPLQETKNG